MIAIKIKHFYDIIFMSYHSFMFSRNTNDAVLTHPRIHRPLIKLSKVILFKVLSTKILPPWQ